jgi:bacteriophage N4 adsorption protein B
VWDVLVAVHRESVLFAVAGFIVGGIDDLIVDAIWLTRAVWRRMTVYRRHARVDALTLAQPTRTGMIAVFVAAWQEDAVIGAMLDHALKAWGSDRYRIYVGVYPNDPATQAAIAPYVSDRLRMIVNDRVGPTTKADCLNALWHALVADERAEGRAKAVVLHDAEDIVHSGEIRVFDTLIERFALVQLPVLPLIDLGSRWIGGHYNDEFAEAHGKTIVVREAIGAGIPSAGVGCAFARDMLGQIADARGGAPFDQDSLTEDYELGLRIADRGGRGAFVRLTGGANSGMVAVRAHFPATLEAAVRQKSRWIAGIALSGWDRLQWRGGLAERWMRLHDRRALLGAIVLVVGYVALILTAVLAFGNGVFGFAVPGPTPLIRILFSVTGALLLWRLFMRFVFVTRAYGWREGLISVPRAVVGNVIAIIAARRALLVYVRMRRDGIVRWDKTAHAFPSSIPAE